MKDQDRIYALFAEANPAPVSTVSAIPRPEADAVLVDHRRPTMLTHEPKILEPRPVKSPARRWRGPAVALASFLAVIVVGVAAFLTVIGGDEQDAADTTPPSVTTTVPDVPTTVPDTTPTTIPTTPDVPGLIAVPDLDGMSVADARALAAEEGFELIVLPEDSADAALIVAQEPVPGAEIEQGAVVTVDAVLASTCIAPVQAAPGVGETTVTVLIECGSDVFYPTGGIALTRVVPEQTGEAIDRIEWTLRSLLSGPTDAERAAGFISFLDEATADSLNSVTLSGGRLVADFNDAILVPNASTSTGSQFFNASLRANVFQYSEVDSVEFRVNGDCEAWSMFFQSDGCWVITRADWDQELAEFEALNNS